jgi:hypothetical protein
VHYNIGTGENESGNIPFIISFELLKHVTCCLMSLS